MFERRLMSMLNQQPATSPPFETKTYHQIKVHIPWYIIVTCFSYSLTKNFIIPVEYITILFFSPILSLPVFSPWVCSWLGNKHLHNNIMVAQRSYSIWRHAWLWTFWLFHSRWMDKYDGLTLKMKENEEEDERNEGEDTKNEW